MNISRNNNQKKNTDKKWQIYYLADIVAEQENDGHDLVNCDV